MVVSRRWRLAGSRRGGGQGSERSDKKENKRRAARSGGRCHRADDLTPAWNVAIVPPPHTERFPSNGRAIARTAAESLTSPSVTSLARSSSLSVRVRKATQAQRAAADCFPPAMATWHNPLISASAWREYTGRKGFV